MEGLGTLTEVTREWTIDDLVDAHEALDLKQEMEIAAMERARQRAGK